MAGPVENPDEARQGERKGWITRVLIISTALAVVLIVLAYVFAV